jgi:hypothetical protein
VNPSGTTLSNESWIRAIVSGARPIPSGRRRRGKRRDVLAERGALRVILAAGPTELRHDLLGHRLRVDRFREEARRSQLEIVDREARRVRVPGDDDDRKVEAPFGPGMAAGIDAPEPPLNQVAGRDDGELLG